MQRGRARQGKFRHRFARETGQSGGGWWIVVMRGRKKKARSCSPHAPSVPLVGIYEPGDSEDRRPIHVQILSNGCPPRNWLTNLTQQGLATDPRDDLRFHTVLFLGNIFPPTSKRIPTKSLSFASFRSQTDSSRSLICLPPILLASIIIVELISLLARKKDKRNDEPPPRNGGSSLQLISYPSLNDSIV